ncbi:SDR family NAD(P)-dependent oxidoreductase [Hydrogenophaga sp. BPS33]|uniref:SDR family NAD(P)-dependent oxidoreductase n=1 Tax=Hydrogenophaga sp. BPS33 TaxID=2651974 RepID=UPI0013204AFD|nr:SDR family oxidoreductase [Hydrogenophaga sp. BPS33]QHE87379.1 SDR family oxidoreductase [Hydrogenophaga sp. BPS33]
MQDERSFAPRERLDGEIAVITGGTGAIGLATAERLAALGARVVLLQRSAPAAAAPALVRLAGSGHCALQANVTDSDALRRAAQAVEQEVGRATVLVNCAGFTRPVPAADLDGLDDALIDSIFATHWRGSFAAVRAFAPQMKAAGDAVVVNVSSIAAFTGLGSNLAYAAAKAGTDALTRALAKTLAPQIRCLAVSPGVVDTPFVAGRDAAFNERVGATLPLKRVGVADDVAAAIVACCTALRYATGSVIVADGGRHLG